VSCAYGAIRNTHESVPTPIETISESIKLARSRPGLRRWIIIIMPPMRQGYTARYNASLTAGYGNGVPKKVS